MVTHFPVTGLPVPAEPQLPENEGELTRTTYTGRGEETCCKIDLVDYKPEDKLIYLPCMHEFHEGCILDWLRRVAICPVCLKPVYKDKKETIPST